MLFKPDRQDSDTQDLKEGDVAIEGNSGIASQNMQRFDDDEYLPPSPQDSESFKAESTSRLQEELHIHSEDETRDH